MQLNLPRGVGYAVGFIIILLLIILGLWAYMGIAGSTGGSSSGGQQGLFGSLFPFGSGSSSGGSTQNPGEVPGASGPAPTLRKVSDQEVAGAEFATGLGGTLAIRYVERNTGHIYETPVDSLTLTRLTNTTVPGVHDATWINASTTLLRFADDNDEPENFVAFFASSTPDQQLEGTFINKYRRIALGAGETVLGVLESASGATVETVRSDGTKPKTLLVSPLTTWVPLAAGNKYFVASAPSWAAPGSLYDISSSGMTRILGGVPGLVALPSPSAAVFLISGGTQNAVSLSVFNTKDKSLNLLPRATLAEKCAWIPRQDSILLCAFPTTLPQARYPDDWLLGRVHTSDDLWFVNTATGVLTEAMALDAGGQGPFDISNVITSENGAYALFINRNDQTLWSATLSPVQ